MKLTIQKRRKPKTKPKAEPVISITIPKSIAFRGGETGTLISDVDNIVVRFPDGGTAGFPRGIFEMEGR